MFKKLFASFDTTPAGYSGRKLSAAAAVLTAIYISCRLLPEAARLYAVFAFLTFAAVCLGLVTIPDLIKFLSSRGGSTVIESTKVETQTTKE